jgi:hypothetical protein
MDIDYESVKQLLIKNGLNILEAEYLGEGILGRFYPPNIILINRNLCKGQVIEKQKDVLVLLHEVCHYIKYQEHLDDYKTTDEETCFEFEVICDLVLNGGYSINSEFGAIKRLGLEKVMMLLKEVIEKCRKNF